MVAGGKLAGRDKIGIRVGKVIGKYKVGKHFDLDIKDRAFAFSVSEARVAAEAALDGALPKLSAPSVRSRALTFRSVRSGTAWKSV